MADHTLFLVCVLGMLAGLWAATAVDWLFMRLWDDVKKRENGE